VQIDDRKSFLAFGCGCTVAMLLYCQPAWYEVYILTIILLLFRRALVRLVCDVRMDHEHRRLEKQLKCGVHVDCDARAAYEFFSRR
jgi:hypothetical protein